MQEVELKHLKTQAMRRVEAEHAGKPIAELLIDLIADGKSHAEIGQEFDVSEATVTAWVKVLQLDRASLAKRIREAECAS